MPPKSTDKSQKTTKKLTKAQLGRFLDEFESYTLQDKKEILKTLGIGTHYFTCQMCGEIRRENDFYMSTDPIIFTGKGNVCKKCCERLVYRVGSDGKKHPPDKDSIKIVLQYLDKPFLNTVWDASLLEAANTTTGKGKNDVWTSYIKNISMVNYNSMRWHDSDIFNINKSTTFEELPADNANTVDNGEIAEMYEQNKKDTIRLLGYDPFQKELVTEQPFLYATLIGYLDASEDANEDRMRTSSIVEIVKGFNHIEKINDLISSLIADREHLESNISTVKALEDTKNKITTSILNLAKDNGISLKHSVNASKGENTWTGKVRKLKEMNLREAEVNIFDAETASGIAQVAEISNAAIINQIALDENDSASMIIEQRELINKYKKMADQNQETARLLLRENIDLKSTLKENGLL